MEEEIKYKKCTKCGEEKPFTREYFYKKGHTLTSRCKLCIKEDRKNYHIENKEIICYKKRQYTKNNKEKISKIKKLYYENNKEIILLKRKNYLKNGGNLTYNEWCKQKRKKDGFFSKITSIRNRINQILKQKRINKNNNTIKYIGCDLKNLKEYIETQFTEGMSWDNQGEWHLDHYYPVSLAETEEDMYIFNHYTNFQPLWAKDNLSKSNKVPDGFEEWYEMMKEKVSQ